MESKRIIQNERLKHLNRQTHGDGPYVIYWMQQSQRAVCNHALEYTVTQANILNKPPLVFFVLNDDFPDANLRHYTFMLEGLADTAGQLAARGIQLIMLHGDVVSEVVEASRKACLLVMDRGYLRIQRRWRAEAASLIECACVQVESDVVVPVETASDKEEYTAGTIRPKIHRQLDRFLFPPEETAPSIPSLKIPPSEVFPRSRVVNMHEAEINRTLEKLDIDRSVARVEWIRGGSTEAIRRLDEFVASKLDHFDQLRNDPGREYLSDMSPYLHFGQISSLLIALRIGDAVSQAAASYLEELIVRRELSMNFVYYNPEYDSYDCLPNWARKTLDEHEIDRRDYIYTIERLELGETHDPYWNAAQKELTGRGKMHGYMRMYWGKKILEWTGHPAEAFDRVLYLNNKYSLDGRDANGYAGTAWCFGKHDRAWSERPVFGKVRYMNEKGLERKFQIKKYVQRIEL